jgi:ribonucleotide reductase alpha subunit
MRNKKARDFHPGMGQAVAERTILRRKENGKWETWADVAHRVALGNSLLCKDSEERELEYNTIRNHIASGVVLMSGRHLQHGDETQPERGQEVFTNCGTSCTSFALFALLMHGSGIGRCYDDDMMLVNWDNAPILKCVLDESHPDFDFSAHESVRDAKHKYGNGKDILWHIVEDTREGWAKALEIWENAAFEKIHKDKMLILDFSKIRAKGTPINGMQGRPASGPVPLMNAFNKASTLKGANLPKWMQTIYIDHYFAECVLVGGARRAARMSTKTWRDKSVFDFITIKRPIEYHGLKVDEIVKLRNELPQRPYGFLWSSNNSITVDQEFWRLLHLRKDSDEYRSELAQHARKVFSLSTSAAYGDGTGEPGFINQDKLNRNTENLNLLKKGDYIGSKRYQINDDTQLYLNRLLKAATRKSNYMIVNPCVVSDTWVLTEQGPRQVNELINKPFKAIVDGQAYDSNGFFYTGHKDVYKLSTDRGYSLTLTNNHKLLVEEKVENDFRYKWKELKDIKINDKIVLCNHSNQEWADDDIEQFDGQVFGKVFVKYFTSEDVQANIKNNTFIKISPFGNLGVNFIEKQSSKFYHDFFNIIFSETTNVEIKNNCILLNNYSRDTLALFQRMLARIGTISNIENNKLIVLNNVKEYTAKVSKIEHIGKEDVYDCTVNDVHAFDANGIKAHNCGEIPLAIWGAFCTIGDIVPFHADSLDEIEDAVRTVTRALIRVNTMDSLYNKEVKRTNRIGVGLTGVHEFAWKFFGYGFKDLIDEEKSKDFWMTLSRFKRAVNEEAHNYSVKLGVSVPHTNTTVKPSGCRPWNALTSTNEGIFTLQELFKEHEDNKDWSIFNGKTNVLQGNDSKRITKTYYNGKSDIVAIRMKYGLTIRSTPEHLWYVKSRRVGKKYLKVNQWIRAGDINPNDILDINLGVYNKTESSKFKSIKTFSLKMRNDCEVINQPTQLNPDLSWLMGYLWGDGAQSPDNYRLRFTDANTFNL